VTATEQTIKAIPTRYAGCHFRSRLEARWAVFFDAMGIAWEYEPEAFVGCWGAPYLPDFYLPSLYVEGRHERVGPNEVEMTPGVYVEVKPTLKALRADSKKLAQCIDYHATPLSYAGLLILGPIPDPRDGLPLHSFLWWHLGIDHGRHGFHSIVEDEWELSREDGAMPADDFSEASDGLPLKCSPIATVATHRPWKNGLRDIERSLAAARSARFEHGQSGPT
jgi:hypothetical protein